MLIVVSRLLCASIANSPPQTASPIISPASPTSIHHLFCDIPAGTTTDADGDSAFTYEFRWTVNGVVLFANDTHISSPAATTSRLDRSAYAKGAVVTCSSRAIESGLPSSMPAVVWGPYSTPTSVTIGDTAPVLYGVAVIPSPLTSPLPTALTCTATNVSDFDGDAVAVSASGAVAWYVNGVLNAGVSSVSVSSGSGVWAMRDTVSCVLTVNDGVLNSNSLQATALVLGMCFV